MSWSEPINRDIEGSDGVGADFGTMPGSATRLDGGARGEAGWGDGAGDAVLAAIGPCVSQLSRSVSSERAGVGCGAGAVVRSVDRRGPRARLAVGFEVRSDHEAQ